MSVMNRLRQLINFAWIVHFSVVVEFHFQFGPWQFCEWFSAFSPPDRNRTDSQETGFGFRITVMVTCTVLRWIGGVLGEKCDSVIPDSPGTSTFFFFFSLENVLSCWVVMILQFPLPQHQHTFLSKVCWCWGRGNCNSFSLVCLFFFLFFFPFSKFPITFWRSKIKCLWHVCFGGIVDECFPDIYIIMPVFAVPAALLTPRDGEKNLKFHPDFEANFLLFFFFSYLLNPFENEEEEARGHHGSNNHRISL